MRFISVCAGIGGIDLGFEWAGLECVAQIEWNEWCRQVLMKHWPTVPKYGDLNDVIGQELPTADVVVGGIPCQPHSLAGKRRGREDDRNLWPAFFRLCKQVRPRWIVVENVPGIVGTMLDEVLSDLEDENYSTGSIAFPACAVDAPHLRERVFILAYTTGQDDRVCFSRTPKGQKYESRESGRNATVADSNSDEQHGRSGNVQMGWAGIKKEAEKDGVAGRIQWPAEPCMGRVAYGVPRRVDRLRGLGNAVVPQVAEFVGRAIMGVERQLASLKD